MRTRRPGKRVIGGLFAFFIVLSLIQTHPVSGVGASEIAVSTVAQTQTDSWAYLPTVMRGFPKPANVFGIETFRLSNSTLQDRAVDANVTLVRYSTFYWDKIEPVRTNPPTYSWSAVNEAGLIQNRVRGLKVIAMVKFTPSWAQMIPGVLCGPIHPDYLDEFAEFMQAVVRRYSVSPYNVQYFELGNEPDIDPDLVAPNSEYGCWGDDNDEYYGGRYYAQMLKVVYPAIKAVNPQVKVLNGGLLLDCDPTNPPPGKDCLPGKFFKGMLRNDAGSNMDIVSYHGYTPWVGNLQWDEHHPYWEHRGGVVLGKLDYLKELMTNKGVNLPVIHTEGGLIGSDAWENPPPDFLDRQANYVIWLYVRSWANNLVGSIWFTLDGPGWRNGGLLDKYQNPRPAYYVYQFLTKELDQAQYVKQITQYPELRAFEFRIAGVKKIWVLWSPDELDHIITLPVNVQKVYDRFGNSITPIPTQLTVNSPYYLEFAP